MKPGITELHAFLTGAFSKQIRHAYQNLEVLSEADLQALAWLLLRDFLHGHDGAVKKFRVFNKPYFRDLNIHPDLAIFRRKKPWVLIELKERKQLTLRSAKKEWKRLIEAKTVVRPKRAYLIYVARWGSGRVLKGPKGLGAKFFFEVPIILEDVWLPGRVHQWEKAFHKWAKFVAS